MYLVECEHLAGHLTAIGQSDAHSVVDLKVISTLLTIDFKIDIRDFAGTLLADASQRTELHVLTIFPCLLAAMVGRGAHECDLKNSKE